jgi:hypothetical protein
MMIKQLTMAALVSAQLGIAAAPAAAADLGRAEEQRIGTFGGVTVRVPLDGSRRVHPVRAGLTLAPTLAARGSDGSATTRIGEGLELGYRSDAAAPGLSLAGRRLGAQQDEAEDEDEGNVSTVEKVALGAIGLVVLAAAAGTLWLVIATDDSSD